MSRSQRPGRSPGRGRPNRSVTTGPTAAATITGTAPNFILNLTIPQVVALTDGHEHDTDIEIDDA